jgi:hypothetical protein
MKILKKKRKNENWGVCEPPANNADVFQKCDDFSGEISSAHRYSEGHVLGANYPKIISSENLIQNIEFEFPSNVCTWRMHI